jgi:hypothetical protein
MGTDSAFESELPHSIAPKIALLQELIRVVNRSGVLLKPDAAAPSRARLNDIGLLFGGQAEKIVSH